MRKIVLRLGLSAAVAMLTLAAMSLDKSLRMWIVIVVGVPSFVAMMMSRRQLGSSFSVMPEARALVTGGLYAKILHPIYLFLDLFLLSVILYFGASMFLWAWGVLIVMQTVQGKREEGVLAAKFGTEYEVYRNQTWF